MSPKKKSNQPPSNISVKGGVKGVGNVIGNNSQSNVTTPPITQKSSSPRRRSGTPSVWVKIAGFLTALAGIYTAVGLFVRLLEGYDALLVAQLVIAGLVAALGISGFLKPGLFVDLFGKLFGKR
jgi:hypothetical protein